MKIKIPISLKIFFQASLIMCGAQYDQVNWPKELIPIQIILAPIFYLQFTGLNMIPMIFAVGMMIFCNKIIVNKHYWLWSFMGTIVLSAGYVVIRTAFLDKVLQEAGNKSGLYIQNSSFFTFLILIALLVSLYKRKERNSELVSVTTQGIG